MPSSRIRLYIETLRHIPPRQLFHLGANRLRTLERHRFPGLVHRRIQRAFQHEWQHTSVRKRPKPPTENRSGSTIVPAGKCLEAFLSGQIEILNRTYSFKEGSAWDLADKQQIPALVEETLHYHTFLLELTSTSQTITRTLDEWWHRYPPGKGNAWQPFAVAYRSQNWIRLHALLAESSADNELTGLLSKLEHSLFEHGLYLERYLERHLGGNHLMKNYCALAMLSAFFEGETADRWFKIATEGLQEQLNIQILPDGGHYERSPMYHSLVIEDLLNAADFLRGRDAGWVDDHLQDPISRMATVLAEILHPDGEIPLFNDSVMGQASPSADLLKRCGQSLPLQANEDTVVIFPETGITRVRLGELTLVVDHGRLGPDELMGHVHNDTLSFELSVGNNRFIVDRGVFEYEEGAKRDECRDISSHNTPSVDGKQQAEYWGSFRVARRWHINNSVIRQVQNVWLIQGQWARSRTQSIERTFQMSTERGLTIVDRIFGMGQAQVRIPLHFGPNIEISDIIQSEMGLIKHCWRWQATAGNSTLFGTSTITGDPASFRLKGHGNIESFSSVHWPRFYVEEKIHGIALTAQCQLPLVVMTMLSLHPDFVEEPSLPELFDSGVPTSP